MYHFHILNVLFFKEDDIQCQLSLWLFTKLPWVIGSDAMDLWMMLRALQQWSKLSLGAIRMSDPKRQYTGLLQSGICHLIRILQSSFTPHECKIERSWIHLTITTLNIWIDIDSHVDENDINVRQHYVQWYETNFTAGWKRISLHIKEKEKWLYFFIIIIWLW